MKLEQNDTASFQSNVFEIIFGKIAVYLLGLAM